MKTSLLSPRRHPRAGFTLVEIMIVVLIIGLLAALALPAITRVQRAAQNSRFINDLRVFAQAFEAYNMQNGVWPNNAGAGVVPTAPVPMTGDFKTNVWQAKTTIGGQWNWDKGNNGFAAGISVSTFTASDAQLIEIDAKIDDGDLTTGLFQKVQPNRVMYILEQ